MSPITRIVVTLFVLQAGCMSLDKAVGVVWRSYGAQCKPPRVTYEIATDSSQCLYHHDIPGCLGGWFEAKTNHAHLLLEGRLHDSSLAHELLHAVLWCRVGDTDHNHVGLSWSTELVKANKLLDRAGY